jgi:hypothetical protein
MNDVLSTRDPLLVRDSSTNRYEESQPALEFANLEKIEHFHHDLRQKSHQDRIVIDTTTTTGQ